MAENTKIQYADHTLNLWWGCEKVSEACKYCYAELLARRFAPGLWGRDAPRKMASARTLDQPRRWNAAARRNNRRARVFVNSMSDFAELLPDDHPQRDELELSRRHFCDMVEQTPCLDWMIFTKRPQNLFKVEPFRRGDAVLPNLWVGTTVETQQRADERIPHLLRVPAAVRFVSYEPALERIDLLKWLGGQLRERPDGTWARRCLAEEGAQGGKWRDGLQWVVAGGESGSHARPPSPLWFESMRLQCEDQGVPFWFKQWGAWCPEALVSSVTRKLAQGRTTVDGVRMVKVGAKQAGDKLKYGTWRKFHELPKQAQLFAA